MSAAFFATIISSTCCPEMQGLARGPALPECRLGSGARLCARVRVQEAGRADYEVGARPDRYENPDYRKNKFKFQLKLIHYTSNLAKGILL